MYFRVFFLKFLFLEYSPDVKLSKFLYFALYVNWIGEEIEISFILNVFVSEYVLVSLEFLEMLISGEKLSFSLLLILLLYFFYQKNRKYYLH